MFAEILQRIVDETGGGIGAVLMGYDGIAVDQYFIEEEGLDLQLLAVEYANVLKEIERAVKTLNTGLMEEVAIRTDRFFVVLRSLTAEYFVLLILQRQGNYGKGRYLLTRETPRLLEALS